MFKAFPSFSIAWDTQVFSSFAVHKCFCAFVIFWFLKLTGISIVFERNYFSYFAFQGFAGVFENCTMFWNQKLMGHFHGYWKKSCKNVETFYTLSDIKKISNVLKCNLWCSQTYLMVFPGAELPEISKYFGFRNFTKHFPMVCSLQLNDNL